MVDARLGIGERGSEPATRTNRYRRRFARYQRVACITHGVVGDRIHLAGDGIARDMPLERGPNLQFIDDRVDL